MHFENLAELISDAKNCRRCALCGGRTNVVCGEGNEKARVMFIGEGPGQNEDLQGRPFVGAAGKFLDELIAVMGFKRQDVYIANVIKCRPPQNRDPFPEEIAACRDYINEQMRLINPQIIVTLGRFSMTMFFERAAISNIHGTPKRIGKTVYYPMYHPAAALYNGSMRNVLIEDARKVPAILKKLDKMENEGFFAKEASELEQLRLEEVALKERLSLPSSNFVEPLDSLHNNQEKAIIKEIEGGEINSAQNRQLQLF